MKYHLHKKSDRIVKLVHEYLGENSHEELLSEVSDHMTDCPECYIYIDSVKQTIQLMRRVGSPNAYSKDIEHRLLKSLNIRK
jgi:predicted anti-sigma-YlaC factor YlaD